MKIPISNQNISGAGQRRPTAPRVTHFVLTTLACVFITTLSACGGGSSDSGGGGGGGTSFAGTYGGFGTLEISAPGIQPVTGQVAITAIVNEDGNVVFDPGSGFEGSGTISGNTITGSYPASLANQPGVNCTGSVDVVATGEGNNFTGTIGPSSIICNGVPFTFTGTFNMSKTSRALLQSTTVGKELREAVRRGVSQ